MLYILIEVQSYSQVLRVRSPALGRLEAEMRTLLQRSGSGIVHAQEGLYLATPGEEWYENAASLLDLGFALRDDLSLLWKELAGFNILIEECEVRSPGEALSTLRNVLLRIHQDDDFWIGPDAMTCFTHLVESGEDGRPAPARRRRITTPRPVLELGEFARRTEVETLLTSTLRTCVASANQRILFLQAEELDLPYITVAGAITEAFGAECEPVKIMCHEADTWSLYPIIRSIRLPAFEIPDGFLSPNEKKLWTHFSGIANRLLTESPGSLIPDLIDTDVMSILKLYLTFHSRKMKSLSRPAVLLCADVNLFPTHTLTLLAEVLATLDRDVTLFPVMVSSMDTLPPQLSHFSAARHRIPAFTEEEAGLRVSRRADPYPDDPTADRVRLHPGWSLLPLFYLLGRGETATDPMPGETGHMRAEQAAFDFVQRKVPELLPLLFIVGRSGGFLSVDSLHDFALRSRMPDASHSLSARTLLGYGFLRDAGSVELSMPALMPLLEQALGDRAKTLERMLFEYLFTRMKEGRIPPSHELLRYFIRVCFPEAALSTLEYILLESAHSSDPEYEEAISEAIVHLRKIVTAEQRSRLDNVLFAGLLRGTLLSGDREGAGLILSTSRLRQESYDGTALLEESRFFSSIGEGRNALAGAKKALLLHQENNDLSGVAKAEIEIGIIMLLEEKLFEAKDYFSIAREAAMKSGSLYDQIRSGTYEAVTLFVYGNYSRCLQTALAACALSESCFLRSYQMLLLLIIGRTYFELGLYGDAVEKFEHGALISDTWEQARFKPVFSAWTARTFLYQGRLAAGREMLENLPRTLETMLFLTEAYMEAGDTDRALEISDAALSLERSPADFLPGEYIPWDNGYAPIENRVFRKHERDAVPYRLLRAMRSYMRARKPDTFVSAVAEFHTLTRREKISEYDPCNSLYFYFYAEILPRQKDNSIEDRVTVLGKAVKYMQERLSRIENSSDKSSYLTKNIWNVRLYNESKRFNLV